MTACINDQLVKTGCYCLNESSPGQFTNMFSGDHTLGVKSDSDEQLIIHLAFIQTFQLRGISIGIIGDNACPATVKLFANQNNLGFSDASETVPTQQLVIEPTEDGTPQIIKIDLQAAKWNRVESGKYNLLTYQA
mmetsp:Transcript_21354/g.36135  ORF Transcript_21354/g.36135 Transcript_21354/m.36135 type:complete len:135 (+) Transcript_21354:73-477(+)|eukprot:CAMPEP_0174955574 /NCGR_PEP_ID=MMETSP0004_2-20121128/1054_1 /TAXON_ID=420556 /ORGANISM="Ochromonas sp., Strain CCMP1393" /LENGTH=134 /DNA_ID=CAMNT_0016203511 /DNA_START=51 /DNA_END=455 /DNA_ORIENTATION=+